MTFIFPRSPLSTARTDNTSEDWSFYKWIVCKVHLFLHCRPAISLILQSGRRWKLSSSRDLSWDRIGLWLFLSRGDFTERILRLKESKGGREPACTWPHPRQLRKLRQYLHFGCWDGWPSRIPLLAWPLRGGKSLGWALGLTSEKKDGFLGESHQELSCHQGHSQWIRGENDGADSFI